MFSVWITVKSWITLNICVIVTILWFHRSLSWQQNHCSGKVETYHCSSSPFKHGRKHAACESRYNGSMSAIVLNRDAPRARLQIENEEVCAQGSWVQRWLITISHAITRLNWVIPPYHTMRGQSLTCRFTDNTSVLHDTGELGLDLLLFF